MKNLYLMVSLMACLILISGCKKQNLTDPQLAQAKVSNPLTEHDVISKLCKVKRVTYPNWDYVSQLITNEFKYDKWGDPDSIVSNFSNTGHPYLHLFHYDNKHRLIEYISLYDNGYYDTWSRFYYDKKGNVSYDSTYLMGWYGEGNPVPPSPFENQLWTRTNYTYDSLNRMITADYHWSTGDNHFLFQFVYDNNGNLISGLGSYGPYDDKVNVNRTNKIWQFLSRNYSVNSTDIGLTSTDYNEFGLPSAIQPYTFLRFASAVNVVNVEYDCK